MGFVIIIAQQGQQIRRRLPLERELATLTDPKSRGCRGSARPIRRQWKGGDVGKRFYWGFRRKEWARPGKQVEDWLVGIISGG